MNVRSLALLAALSVFAILPALGQTYFGSLGFRTGSATGLAYKQFVNSFLALETQLIYRQDGLQAVALLAPHLELGYRSGFYLFAGGGLHGGYQGIFSSEQSRRSVWGVDALVGFEYVSENQPFALSFDIKPTLEMGSGSPIPSGNQAGVTLRYLFP
ncbi:MAG: hypothetical protein D6722_23220 [Bacteroidetes bacterium]|nr:MAG: hypothetical protein D6722_23220 [Bacteroidota bacterium]